MEPPTKAKGKLALVEKQEGNMDENDLWRVENILSMLGEADGLKKIGYLWLVQPSYDQDKIEEVKLIICSGIIFLWIVLQISSCMFYLKCLKTIWSNLLKDKIRKVKIKKIWRRGVPMLKRDCLNALRKWKIVLEKQLECISIIFSGLRLWNISKLKLILLS